MSVTLPSLPSVAHPRGTTPGERVFTYLSRRYPANLLTWVPKARWHGPVSIELHTIDGSPRPGGLNEDNVARFVGRFRNEEDVAPVVLVRPPVGPLQIVDGWHRLAAARRVGFTAAPAYVGQVASSTGPWTTAMPLASGPPKPSVTESPQEFLSTIWWWARRNLGLGRVASVQCAYAICTYWAGGNGQADDVVRDKARRAVRWVDAMGAEDAAPSVGRRLS